MDNKKEVGIKFKDKIDIERLVYKVGMISNITLWIPIILNRIFWHNSFLSGITVGWNLCLIVVMIIVSIAGHRNFKYEMEQLKWLMCKYDMDGDDKKWRERKR